MAEPHDLLKARRESAALLNLGDVERLSPADALRCDLISTLRLAIDSEQATVLDGGSADLAKLITATENLIRLLPGRSLPEPESQHEDPRETMWQIYKTMRARGALGGEGYDGKVRQVEALQAEVAALEGEIATLKGGATPALPDARYGLPDVLAGHSTGHGGSAVITPRENAITPPNEIGVCSTGRIVGADDPKPPVTIEGAKVPAPDAPASPAYDYNANDDWKDFVEPDGSIRTTARGRGQYWGPV